MRIAVHFLLAMLAAAPPSRAADWPQWRGPDENGISVEPLPATAGFETVVWKASVGTGFSSVAVAGGRVYTMGHTGEKARGGREGSETVWCFDAETGREIWRDTYAAPLIDHLYEGGPGSTPAVRDGKVYTYSKHGRLHCYDVTSGKRLWERDMMAEAGMREPPEWGFACSPCLADDGLLVIEAGATFGLDAGTGEVRWKGEKFTPAYGTPRVFRAGDRRWIAVMKSEGLVVLDAADGATVAKVEWQTPFDTSATTPIIDGNRIFISTGYDRGCALLEFDAERGELQKTYESAAMSNHMNNCVLTGGHLYGFDGTAHRGRPTEFVCIEFPTGKEKWRVPRGEGLGCGSVMAAGGGAVLLLMTERGELVSAPATPEGFAVTSRAQVLGGRCWTVPVLSGGRIYCRNAAGDLVCVAAD